MCCHILKADEEDKINNIAIKATAEGEGDPGLSVAAIRKLLESFGRRLRPQEGWTTLTLMRGVSNTCVRAPRA
jgi:hypothetical protein